MEMRQENLTNNSRAWANQSRDAVLRHAKGCCEICGDFAPYILESHHIVPHASGGLGSSSNLIALCPNCHAIVEKLRTSMIDDPHFHNWIRQRYDEGEYEKFGMLFQQRRIITEG